jgi:hypothetical protein
MLKRCFFHLCGSITNRCVPASDHPRADFLPEPLKKILG